MEQFFTDVVDAFLSADYADAEAPRLARGAISEIETALMRPETFAARLGGLTGRYRTIIEAAVGAPVKRLLITPMPGYLLAAIPDILSEFPGAVLADNFKAGTEIAGRTCITLDEALADPEGFDAYVLGTVDQRLGRQFRERLPPERTIAAAELVWFDPASQPREVCPALEQFNTAIRNSRRPLLVLAAYLDATLGPTFEALNIQGFDVFIVTRQPFADTHGHNTTDPSAIGVDRHYVAEFDEMLWLLRQIDGCPVLVNYARFFASNWDLRNTIPLFAYSIAILQAIEGPRVLHLYDVYQVCLHGLEEAEIPSFLLYRHLLDLANGILVNSGAAPVLQELMGPDKPIIGFLRYGPEAESQPEPDPGPFSIAMITGFLGEENDPTRMTAEAVRTLLRQQLHVHYYSSSPTARTFLEALPAGEAFCFHIHPPIRDQRELIREISRYHAGWFLVDTTCCDHHGTVYQTPFARHLAVHFIPTAVATAGILSGCAGLPTFFSPRNYGATLFPPGTTFDIRFDEVQDIKSMIDHTDWSELRRRVRSARRNFSTGPHIARLGQWLSQFYENSKPNGV